MRGSLRQAFALVALALLIWSCTGDGIDGSENGGAVHSSEISLTPIQGFYIAGRDMASIPTDGDLLKTEDSGMTWSRTAGEAFGKFEHVYFNDAQHGWALTLDGRCWQTVDAGLSWYGVGFLSDYESEGFGGRVTQLFAVDGNHAWALTILGIWRTRDGGATWEQSFLSGVEEMGRLVLFAKPDNGWLLGVDGGFYTTQNGGDTWTKISTIAGENPTQLFFFARESTA